jgi:hypothetical protein
MEMPHRTGLVRPIKGKEHEVHLKKGVVMAIKCDPVVMRIQNKRGGDPTAANLLEICLKNNLNERKSRTITALKIEYDVAHCTKEKSIIANY